jgi:hypothetical protein
MHCYETEIDIAATPDTVWAILTDAGAYASWNSAVDRIEGTIEPGATVTVYTSADPEHAYPVKVSTFEAPRKLVWGGGMPLGLFKGVRTFDLEPGEDSTVTKFKMREEYTGPMLGMIWKQMPDLGPAFEEFARSLKTRAEHGS